MFSENESFADLLSGAMNGSISGYEVTPNHSSTEAEGSSTEVEQIQYGSNSASSDEQLTGGGKGQSQPLAADEARALAGILAQLTSTAQQGTSDQLKVADSEADVRIGANSAPESVWNGTDVASNNQMQEQLLQSYMDLMKLNE